MPSGCLIDMDGVLTRGPEMIPGADRFVQHCARGTPFLLLTNNSQRTRRDIATTLQRIGLPVEEADVFTSAMATARFLARQTPHGTAYGVGGEGRAFSPGKPSPIMMGEARKQLGLTTDETTIIGDTMETDILGGVQLGFHTVLVLSGGTSREDVRRYAYQPERIVESIADLSAAG